MEKNQVSCGFVPMQVNGFVLNNTYKWWKFLMEWNNSQVTKNIIIESFQQQLCNYFRHVIDNNFYSQEDQITLNKFLNSFNV